MIERVIRFGIAGALVMACHAPGPITPSPGADLTRVNHVVVIYLENRSFDNLYGEFAGANGLEGARRSTPQIDERGVPFRALPQASGTPFPPDLPNAPFDIGRFVPPTVPTRDLVHRFYHEQAQIDHGRMDRFVSVSDALGLTLGYYHTAELPLAALAREFTLCDGFFHSAFGGSFLNHQWLIAARTPEFRDAPPSMRASIDSSGTLRIDGAVTPDGFVVNTAYSVQGPHPVAPQSELMPPLTYPTIGDRLDDKSISWAWYAGGWRDADDGHPSPDFQFHHQPFVYFAHFAGRLDRTARTPAGRDGVHRGGARGDPAVCVIRQTHRLRERTPRLHRRHSRRTACGRVDRRRARGTELARHGDHRDVRRERRLLGSCGAASRRPLGAGNASAHNRDFAVRATWSRRPHHIRNRLDPRPDRTAMGPRAARRARRAGGSPYRSARPRHHALTSSRSSL